MPSRREAGLPTAANRCNSAATWPGFVLLGLAGQQLDEAAGRFVHPRQKILPAGARFSRRGIESGLAIGAGER